MEDKAFVCQFERSSPTCEAPASWYTQNWDLLAPKTGWYFLYGTLTDSAQLAKVLNAEEQLILCPARVVGYKVMFCGRYPAMLEGTPKSVVRGAAFRVKTTTQASKLQGYETNAYRVQTCMIHFEDDGKEVSGYAFMWDRRPDELKEGQFDLRDGQEVKLEQKIVSEEL